jgi:Ca2+/Na+ antiporter
MSESLAGVTFLAFGNGSADVVSSIVASGMNEDGIYMATSGLIGACCVNSFFLAPLVVLLSKKAIKLPSATYGRDVSFLLFCLALLLSYMISGTIHWYMAAFFPILYAFYVSFCFFQEKWMKKEQEEGKGDDQRATELFEEDLASSQTKAEAIGEEIVRREGESFVKYTSIDVSSFIEGHMKEPELPKEKKVITVSPTLARYIRNRLITQAIHAAIKM